MLREAQASSAQRMFYKDVHTHLSIVLPAASIFAGYSSVLVGS
jgi:hypothetical protein